MKKKERNQFTALTINEAATTLFSLIYTQVRETYTMCSGEQTFTETQRLWSIVQFEIQ